MENKNKRKHSDTHNFGRTQIKRADGFPFPGFRQVERKPKRGLHECKHLYISRNVNRKQVRKNRLMKLTRMFKARAIFIFSELHAWLWG